MWLKQLKITWNFKKKNTNAIHNLIHTHTHTHTHIYIYIYHHS